MNLNSDLKVHIEQQQSEHLSGHETQLLKPGVLYELTRILSTREWMRLVE